MMVLVQVGIKNNNNIMIKTEVIKIKNNEYMVYIWIDEKVSHTYKLNKTEMVALQNQILATIKNN